MKEVFPVSFFRVFIQKKEGFRNEAKEMLSDLKETLQVPGLTDLELMNFYEMDQVDREQFDRITQMVFSEPNTDDIREQVDITGKESFAWEALPGQFDQRADSAAQCIRLLYPTWMGQVKTGRYLKLQGNLSDAEIEEIKHYIINPLENQLTLLDATAMEIISAEVTPLRSFQGFITWSKEELEQYRNDAGMAMTLEDLLYIQTYFKEQEQRDPSETELKVLDTYWSDHCRHTTFETELNNVEFPQGKYGESIKKAWLEYQDIRNELKRQEKPLTLMDLATLAGREMRAKGQLDDMEVSEEINACSVKIDVDAEGKKEPWLLMFKNETHNHPTEIEPFGGASTCIGGAIRDPLSGRSYVYQAMRITGSGDPTVDLKDTLPGKLPQKVITRGAAHGYSSYGNQIGLATSLVREIYHPGYQAKRMEVGAVVGAAPLDWVRRESPSEGDVILLLGGKTGRDGCGGATGSSKAHTEESLMSCGAEVQKGNAPEERKIQRLFRNPEVTSLIKKCNDFGAGGVSVAIGELSDGLNIDLDKVPVKYLGLNGTELAISESQERMAVVVEADKAAAFKELAAVENLEAINVAVVTSDNRLKMNWRGKVLVDLDRSFLDTNGVRSHADVIITAPDEQKNPFKRTIDGADLEERFLNNLSQLNVCSQTGLSEMFDSSIGAGTVFMPLGGKNQLTETECSAHKIPHMQKDTDTASLIAHGFNPQISSWSPYHGSQYAVVESMARLAATGGNWKMARLSFQEYFRRLTHAEIWGQPLAALLGALQIQRAFKAPAIGGKDSMSGSFGDMHVPPTLISFAVTTGNASELISSEFKQAGSKLYYLKHQPWVDLTPDTDQLISHFELLDHLRSKGKLRSAQTVKEGGLAEILFKGCLGNNLGIRVDVGESELYDRSIGSLLIEVEGDIDQGMLLGEVLDCPEIRLNDRIIPLEKAEKHWRKPLQKVFHDLEGGDKSALESLSYHEKAVLQKPSLKTKPKVLIPVFPGTNCEYDTARAFRDAGADPEIMVFRNRNASDIERSLDTMAQALNQSQILMLSGGFSAGDEPDGSGKFIANVLRNSAISDSVHKLLDRDGLILGICNGFQALLKSGLLPGGRIGAIDEKAPTLAHNQVNRHISRMVSTRVSSVKSPWMWDMKNGDIHQIAISHGEGRFAASKEWVKGLKEKGQICFQYANAEGNASMMAPWNPNGSVEAIEGICSEDGRILGKMGHTERYHQNLFRNIPGDKYQPLFTGGVKYFS